MPSATEDATKIVRSPFRQWSVWLPIVLLNLILLASVLWHDPTASYDSTSHRRYARILAEGRLATRAETKEFFSPPLAYLPSSAMQAMGIAEMTAEKTWQILNVGYSVLVCILLVKIFLHICPGRERWAGLPIWLLAMFPVYYRTFSMPRSEPLVVLLGLAGLYLSLKIATAKNPGYGKFALLGVVSGLLILSRQWGYFLLPGIYLPLLMRFFVEPDKWAMAKRIATALTLLCLTGGWFYLHLFVNYGSITSFNRKKKSFSFSRVYEEVASVRKFPLVFHDPVRPVFGNASIPIFYADTWGDYWAYYLVAGKDTKDGRLTRLSKFNTPEKRNPAGRILTNQPAMSAYLARVNLVSLIPTTILLVALLYALREMARQIRQRPVPKSIEDIQSGLLMYPVLMAAVTLLGYGWFQVHYASPKGDTIKASYMIQLFPLLSLIGAWSAMVLHDRKPQVLRYVLVVMLLVAVHNSGAFVTRLHPSLVDIHKFSPAPALEVTQDDE